MDVFQFPLEALAFNQLSFGFLATVQSFLTCIAIVTAAISFWRIRASGSNSFHRTKSSGDSPPSLDVRSTLHVSPPPLQVSIWSEPESEKEKPFHQEKEKACSSLVGVGVGAIECDDKEYNTNDRVIKGKFTLYYDDDVDTDTSSREVDPIPIDGNGSGVGVDVVFSYREELYYYNGNRIWVGRGPRGCDLGWYSSRDLTVLNGNVVRLWDHHRRRCLRPSDCFLAL